MTASSSRLLPPGPALRLAAVLIVILLGVAVTVGLVLGLGAGVGAALGGLMVLVMALQRGPVWHPVAFGLAVAGLAAGATTLDDSPLGVGLLTAAAALVSAPVVLRYGPVVGIAPVVVAAAGTDVATIGPGAAFIGVAAGAAALPAIAAAMGLAKLDPTPLPARIAWPYVAALALGGGAAIGVARALDVSHAMWVVIALSAVLIPVRGETSARARRRVVGTVIGTLAGAVLASLLVSWLAGALAVLAAVVGTGWALARDEVRGAAFTAAALVLVAGVASTAGAWDAAVQRVELTVVGVALAVLLALGLARLERMGERP
ncbi:FUSC family protein [Demequina mangrovi]|uniref:Fusaric acid resistance protein-like n=1 Tax=Demequina mangrovi TaxID=1043493 RepID=A0A1H6X1E9_9MICO|nr:FUSC family protein [Demequina mangrovi]SEJ21966.1 Fusaric acid resistance protein-like [Demequina mangrovi]